MRRETQWLVVHCSATPLSSDIGADEIEDWHKARGFNTIGYHAVIRLDGKIEFGRHFDEVGAHVKGWNTRSIGICLVGGVDEDGAPKDTFSTKQKQVLRILLAALQLAYPGASVCGHRDLSPDLNGDGIITSDEWMKDCPCFDVRAWYNGVGLSE